MPPFDVDAVFGHGIGIAALFVGWKLSMKIISVWRELTAAKLTAANTERSSDRDERRGMTEVVGALSVAVTENVTAIRDLAEIVRAQSRVLDRVVARRRGANLRRVHE